MTGRCDVHLRTEKTQGPVNPTHPDGIPPIATALVLYTLVWELGRLNACARSIFRGQEREEAHKARVRVKKERASVWREGTRLRTACIRSRCGASGSASGGRCPGNAAASSCQRGWRLAASLAFPSAPLWFLLSAGPGCATDIRAVWPEKGCLHTTPLLLQRCLCCSRCSALARARPLYTRAPTRLLHPRENSSPAFCQRELRCGLFGTTF